MTEKTFTEIEVDAALSVWEAMLDFRARRSLPALDRMFSLRGTSVMRSYAVALGVAAEALWSSLSDDEQQDERFTPFDWEFCPAFVSKTDWTGSLPVPPTREQLLATPTTGE